MKRYWPVSLCLALLVAAIVLVCAGRAHAQAEWDYRRTITLDHTQVDADLADFPALISITTGGEGEGRRQRRHRGQGDPASSA